MEGAARNVLRLRNLATHVVCFLISSNIGPPYQDPNGDFQGLPLTLSATVIPCVMSLRRNDHCHILTPIVLVDTGIRTRDLMTTKHSGYLLGSRVKR